MEIRGILRSPQKPMSITVDGLQIACGVALECSRGQTGVSPAVGNAVRGIMRTESNFPQGIRRLKKSFCEGYNEVNKTGTIDKPWMS